MKPVKNVCNFYTVLTTICAFLSLILAGIKPIIDFGWMMTLGLSVSLIVTFYLLPSLIMVFSNDDDIELQETKKSIITNFLANIAKKQITLCMWLHFYINCKHGWNLKLSWIVL